MIEKIQIKPVVSIVIPCRNEVRHIGNLLNSIFDSDYDQDLLEVFVIDGMSDDGTLEMLHRDYLSKHSNLHLLCNSMLNTPYAFNIGIKESSGDILIILGARHIICRNYIREVVCCLKENDKIGCVGGVVYNSYENKISEIISKAMASPFGIGFNNFRSINIDTFVDTIGSPAYRRSIFSEIGYFDENLSRNQDDDFNFRLLKIGYKILLKSSISIKYYVRSSFINLFIQFKQYGYWKVYVNKKHKTITTMRQLFPPMFVMSVPLLLILTTLDMVFIKILLFELVFYILLGLFFSIRSNGLDFLSVLMQMFACFVLHLSYGIGYIEGILDFLLLNKLPSKRNEKLSR